ncbi:FAD:protein FMN transferase [Novimethylophilus kurashikiensis]|uniref:FAD:protein FMN transferase n=1 Tax=Novimethylophilus kurashikiensis TaxID=1825523 RepID=A0A2R5FJI0_9PROT|nr:FAD:protein FMN transferase [Novimethylophilus kurashikiensis]GBG15904.1 FAD:protein FMN transferase [Novimethylophilus kurashikiensis]
MTSPELTTFRLTFDAMGSSCEVMLAAVNEAEARRLAQFAIDEVKRIEHKYSRYTQDGVTAQINRAAGGDWIQVDEETLSLLSYADSLYEASGGLFDMTSGVLRRAWNFKQPALPSETVLNEALSLIGWHRVERDGEALRLPDVGMEVDFGGFGKEYAADRAAEVLMGEGVQHGYVNLAGDMRIIGPKPDGQPWQIGIQDPRVPGRVVATIPVESGALATSGDYERFFELDGKRYCHILDPKRGFPVGYWRSISVLAPVAIVAGSCTTIAMLKEQAGIEFLESTGMDYLAIDHGGENYQKTF